MGAMTEAVVIIATVEDPCAVLRIRAIPNGMKSPSLVVLNAFPAIAPMPVSLMIIPNIPPAAVTIRIGPAFSIALSKTLLIVFMPLLLSSNNENTTPIIKAITGCPVKTKTLIQLFAELKPLIVNRDPAVIRNNGTAMGRRDDIIGG